MAVCAISQCLLVQQYMNIGWLHGDNMKVVQLYQSLVFDTNFFQKSWLFQMLVIEQDNVKY